MAWLWTVPLNGMLGLAGYWVARHGFRQEAGLPRTLAAATLAWTWATVGMELLGVLGLLSLGPLLVWTTGGLAIGFGLRRVDRRNARDVRIRAEAEPWEWEAIVALGLVIWVAVWLGVQSLWLPVKVVSDGPIYHLYFAARWWKAGRLFLVAAPFGESAATYFPAVGDLWFTWLMVSWGGDRLAKVGQVPFLFLSALAAFGLARRLATGRSAALIATAWFVTSHAVLLFSFEPNVDTIFMAGYLLACFFFLRYALDDDGPAALALGGLAAGGALGSKAIGIVFVPVLIALMVLAILARPGPVRRKVGHVALVAGMPLMMGGFWYARNAWLTGNPLYPLHVEAFGRVWLAGWYGSAAMRLSSYYLPASHWRALGDILLVVLDPRLAPFWLAAIAGAWRRRGVPLARPVPDQTGALAEPAAPRGRAFDRWVWLASGLALGNVALYWLLIPYRTQQRFMLHALGLMVVPLGRMFDRGRGLRVVAMLLLAVHLLTPQGWPLSGGRASPPWDLTPMVPNYVPALIPFPLTLGQIRRVLADPQALMLALLSPGLGLLAMGVARAWVRAGESGGWRAFARAGVVSLALFLAATLMVVPLRADPRQRFFPVFPDYLAGWLELDSRSGPTGVRVAYAGTNLPYYLLGVGLRNEVRYVNIDAHRDWLMHDYYRAARARGQSTWPNPRPGWDRAHPDYDAWLANLRAAKIQLLVVARANIEEGPQNIADPERFPIERRWAESHPESFKPLYGVAEGDPQFRIYRVRG